MDAFDADVLIYAADPKNELGARVRALFAETDESAVGSVLLWTELLPKPMRERWNVEVANLLSLMSRLDLRPVDDATARLATALAVEHALPAIDSVHLATAIQAGADRFITNNRKDFRAPIADIEVVYPSDLPSA
ncbi:MAG: hypothetical protein RI900_2989 [Actinomycetota bacterium]|jgi:predicted nucleic acid-binding protein